MKQWRKVAALGLAVVLPVCAAALTGCQKQGEKTLSVMVGNDKVENLTITKDVEALYPGDIDWVIASSTEQVSLMFASGDYPDVVFGNTLQDSDVSKYAANGVLVPLEDYITEEITPNICRLFDEYPSTRAISTFADGHIYALPRFNGIAAEYLESVLHINKAWLDKLELEIPETTEDLYQVLKAFKEGDPNGNGIADEIPMTFLEGSGDAFPEALLSCWGVATKHGNYEGFLTVQNGEVKFAPAMDEWKEMIRYYNRLHAEGLLDMEAFTQSNEQYYAKLLTDTPIVGVSWSRNNPFTNGEYISIAPIHAPGYDALWHIHPGKLGVKNVFEVTNHCQDVEAAMRWIDNFYTEEFTLFNWYGPEGEVFTKKDGIYYFNEPEEGLSLTKWCQQNTIAGTNSPGVFLEEELGTLVEANSIWTDPMEDYKLYEPYLDGEPWPRPYYTEESIGKIVQLRTDIINVVNQTKANWIVGTNDVDADWDQYLQNLENIGIQEYIDLNQKAYDEFYKALTE